MRTTHEIVMAGFGGQGVLFAGRLLAYCGMMAGKEVAWCPSYGPEMRGGTANCSTIISDESVGSPIILSPSALIAMNKPSFEKFEKSVQPGGLMLIDSSLIDTITKRTDVTFVAIPATQIANDMNAPSLANMVLVGQLLKQTGLFTMDEIHKGLSKAISTRKKDLYDMNVQAIETGYNYSISN
ncbi:MAG: 2-oxoacid:acceptor oxidoreductase family protein [Hyphomonadaceae bacterium]|nr:2-oxoacid:acceptor oxidoreductase family protein [Clostridia bacterium]